MNIANQLLLEHSKKNSILIAEYIGTDKERFAELMQLFFANTYRVTQRAAAALSTCYDKHPYLIEPYLPKLVYNLKNDELHVAIKRNTVRVLQFIPIPEELQSELFDVCLAFINKPEEAIAVKAFSMTILYNVCKEYPDLKNEVIHSLNALFEYEKSSGILSRGRKILNLLHKL